MTELKRPDGILLTFIFVTSLLLRLLLVIPAGFDGLYGQDPYAYYGYAQQLIAFTQIGTIPEPFFWPVGYPALLALSFSLFGIQPVVAQAVTMLSGMFLALLVYIFGRQLGAGRSGAFSAAVLMSVSGQALQSSIVIMSDIPALTWSTTSAITLWRYRQTGNRGWLALATITLVFAIITRWLYLLLLLPWGIVVLTLWWRTARTQWHRVLVDIALVAGIALLAFAPQIAQSGIAPSSPLDHAWVQGWSLANALRTDFITIDGHLSYPQPNALFYAQPYYHTYFISPVFTLFLFLGIWTILRQRYWYRATILLTLAILPYLFLVGIPYQNIRFPLLVFPAVAVLVGFGLDAALHWIKARNSLILAGLGTLVVIGFLHTLSSGIDLAEQFIKNQQRDKAVAAWVSGQIPETGRLYTFGLTLTLEHYTSLDVVDLYFESPDSLAQQQARENDYLLVNIYNIETQWGGYSPQINYDWLRDWRAPENLGHYGQYTLFRLSR